MAETCVFGPVPSRRFGRSLGIDVVPFKVCTLSCAYCQLGPTPEMTIERREYVTLDAVRRDLPPAVARAGEFDVATFSGSGEPTLNSGLGEIIRYAKTETGKPVVVLTNGSLLWMPDVRADLAAADIVCPSLDAATEEVFRRVNRPAEGLELARILEGMAEFRRGFAGEIRLEVFLVPGLTDTEESVAELAAAAARIAPDKIELNTAARRPAEPWVRAVPRAQLIALAELFNPKATVIPEFDAAELIGEGDREVTEEEVLAYLERRPAGADELAAALRVTADSVRRVCDGLLASGRIRMDGPVYLIHD